MKIVGKIILQNLQTDSKKVKVIKIYCIACDEYRKSIKSKKRNMKSYYCLQWVWS